MSVDDYVDLYDSEMQRLLDAHARSRQERAASDVMTVGGFLRKLATPSDIVVAWSVFFAERARL